jgi:predicted nuclease of predicted toxin-antitoxin system
VRFLLDENLSPKQAKTFKDSGFDAISVVEAGLAGDSDGAVRAFAISSDRVLVTLDGDFANIVRYPPGETPGVIRLRLHPPTESAITSALERVVRILGSLDLRGKLAIVDEDKIRIRG